MSARRLRLPVVAATAVALGVAVAVPVAPGSSPKVPKVKTRIAKVQIDLEGFVEIRRLKDTTSDCFPGVRWTQTNRYDFDTRGFVNVSLKRVTGDGFDPIVTSPRSRAVGSAAIAGKISDAKETNYCTSAPVENPKPPTCGSTRGRTAVSLAESPAQARGDEELAPLTQAPLFLNVWRIGGGRDEVACLGGGADRVLGKDAAPSVVSTSVAPGVSETIPSGLSVIKVFNIRPGQRFSRTVVVSGPCSNVTLRTVNGRGGQPPALNLNADGDCTLRARIAYTIRPRPKTK